MNEQRVEDERQEELAFTLDDIVSQLLVHVEEEDLSALKATFLGLSATDQADVIEKLDAERRTLIIEQCYDDLSSAVFSELSSDVKDLLLVQLTPQQIAEILSDLESDDALDLIETLDPEFQQAILRQLSSTMRAAVEESLSFPEESAGRLMQREIVAIPEFWSVGQALDYLKTASDHLPETFHSVYTVDPRHHIRGEVILSQLLSEKRDTVIQSLQNEDIFKIEAETDQEDVARLFNKEHLFSTPVIDENKRLIGVITADDIMHVIEEEAEEDILKLGGVSGASDIYKDIISKTKSRFSWLAINLLTAILASVVINMFQATIEQIVALAVLMPIVASMGGNAGTQTLTIAVRALATKEMSNANVWRFIMKETAVGFLNGVLFAILVGLVTWFWFSSSILGLVIALAMIVNMLVAGIFGISIPVLLDKTSIDPALASGVFLTTVTDVIGFFSFLGLASIILL